jgi:hypothetical protein
MKLFVIGILTTLLYSVSYAEVELPKMVYGEPTGESCETEEGRRSYLKDFTEALYSPFLERIENVPPDEEAYLSQEYENAHNEERLEKLLQRPFFPAWEFRKDYRDLMKEIETPGMFRRPGASPKEREVSYLFGIAATHRRLQSALKSYGVHDSTRLSPYLEGVLSFAAKYSILDSRFFFPNIEALVLCSLRH